MIRHIIKHFSDSRDVVFSWDGSFEDVMGCICWPRTTSVVFSWGFVRPIRLDTDQEHFIVHHTQFIIHYHLSTSILYQLFIGCEKNGNEQNSKKKTTIKEWKMK